MPHENLTAALEGSEIEFAELGTVEIQAAAGVDGAKSRRVSILAYAGGEMRPELPAVRLVIDLAGVRARAATIPILRDHNPNRVLGQCIPEVDSKGIRAAGTLCGIAREVADVTQPAADGFHWAASIGGGLSRIEFVDKDRTAQANGRTWAGPLVIARRCELSEISIVAVGADVRSTVRIMARHGSRKDGIMPEPTNTPTVENPEPSPDAVQAAILADRERVAKIDKICAQYGMEQNWPYRAAAIAGTVSLDALELAASKLSEKRSEYVPQGPRGVNWVPNGKGGLMHGMSTEVLAAAAMMSAGYESMAEKAFGAQACTIAADLHVSSSLDLCKAALVAEHQDIPRSTDGIIKASFSTASLPAALGASAEKMMAETFRDTPASWRSWCATKPVKNFKPHQSIRGYLKDGGFEEVGADGELKHAAIEEEVYTHRASTFGKMFSVTRQTIINDDLGIIYELSAELARQGVRKISDEVYRLLLSDAGTFFVVDVNYIEGADTLLSFDSLPMLIQKIRTATDADGNPIDLPLGALVVPPALETVARGLLNSTEVRPGGANAKNVVPTGNPLHSVVPALEIEPRLSSTAISANASDTAWYLFTKPGSCPAIIISFLNGKQMPTVEQVELPGNVLGIGYRGFIDFGVDFADSRGGAKSKGAA